MWHWDQGRLEYFQFDNLRKMAQFVMRNDFKHASRDMLNSQVGLPFSAPPTHSPWRNYSRILRLMLLVHLRDDQAVPTAVAEMLATPGVVTCDEYLHFIASVFTEPSPALKDWNPNWNPNLQLRYPLLFALKYLLIKLTVQSDVSTSFDEIIGAYSASCYTGGEDQTGFITLLNIHPNDHYENVGRKTPYELYRQARESLLFLAQISYLHVHQNNLIVSLDQVDAINIFDDLQPMSDNPVADREQELLRRSELFREGSTYNYFDYSNTIMINEIVESGFLEGGRVRKTHITIERNSGIRREYFNANPHVTCDVCRLDTRATYPWANLIIDLHHLLPLASGTRVEISGTTFADLVPVCPTCHRATHLFYDRWLTNRNRKDFADRDEARSAYTQMKNEFRGLTCVTS
jgi:hypothetical protein